MRRSITRRTSFHAGALALSVAFAFAAGCSSEQAGTLKGGGGGDNGGADGGAGVDPPPADAPAPPFVALPAEVYVSKVKNLMTGLPPTSAEIEAVRADPGALRGLVDGWMANPNFEEKMLAFFALAFQTPAVTRQNLNDMGVPTPPQGDPAGLYANIAEMVPRTALDAMKRDLPFNQLLSTRSFMMTSALASFMAYLDRDQGALNKEAQTLYNTPTTDHPATGIPLGQSVTDKVWFADKPFANAKCADPTTTEFHSSDLLYLLYGQLRCGLTTVAVTPVMAPTDFTDWRMVEMKDATATLPAATFYDIPAMRTATSLPLAIPRAGFFMTPGFLQTWVTNKDNLYRLTTNQALIVALGISIDGTDTTVPLTGLGAAASHVQAPCVGCHQTLEPMKNYFAQSMSVQYRPQLDKTLASSTASFSLGGVTRNGGTVADLATTLASHPAFATGWTQKLLYWASSVGAEADDPELARIAQAFTDSGFKWKTLVREVMTSPLVTGSAASKTFTDREFVVSLSRRQHWGYALSKRLGLPDPFANTKSLASNIPADEFSRAAVEPALNASPGMFYRATVEAVCLKLAPRVVDGTNPVFSSATPDKAILDMVTNLVGMPDADPRQRILVDALTAHFAAAKAAGAKPGDAMQSTFTVACSSPVTAAMGL